MKNRQEAINYCKQYKDVYEDEPFRDNNWTLIRHKGTDKTFAWIFERDVKNEPGMNEQLRNEYDSIVPAYHLNKEHWNSIILDGTVPKEEIQELIKTSYNITKNK
ncbi:MmcQ/YjbR family DNA-binding protein [Terribacillus goriensis]|uniref:MmcQ/YjbR family DNA-binding protein n=1 Tax=Terribacillus saccharophilus TaxID=361277 RepID=UPI003983C10A